MVSPGRSTFESGTGTGIGGLDTSEAISDALMLLFKVSACPMPNFGTFCGEARGDCCSVLEFDNVVLTEDAWGDIDEPRDAGDSRVGVFLLLVEMLPCTIPFPPSWETDGETLKGGILATSIGL